jgi:hypothetical protein
MGNQAITGIISTYKQKLYKNSVILKSPCNILVSILQ